LQLIVHDYLTDHTEDYEGSDVEVKSRLFKDFPYLLSKLGWDAPIDALVKDLDRQQMFSAVISSINLFKTENLAKSIEDTPQLYSKDGYLDAIRAACEFLSGIQITDLKVRQALLANDGDELQALLEAHNLEVSKDNLDALKAVLAATLSKSEPQPIKFNEVKAYNDSGTEFAAKVSRAAKSGNIFEINLGTGKHSKGTLIATDPETLEKIILKPGAGKQNPASGEGQNPASQSAREAAFYAMAKAWQLDSFLPECYLLELDGNEYAAMKFLRKQWVNGNDLKAEDPNMARRLLAIYLNDGTLHKLAMMDYILGNPDRHSGNIMFCGPEIKLIDHGSALAGIDFRPGVDNYSFVPYYLRVFAPKDFSKQLPEEKLLALPRINQEKSSELAVWLQHLDNQILLKILIGYNIDPAPEEARLEFLKVACGVQPADLAINSAWVMP
jgi:hypothetical protein